MNSHRRDNWDGHGRAFAPGMKGGMVGTMVAGVGPPLVGNISRVCVVVMGLLEGIPMIMDGKDIGPPLNIPPWKGSGCTPAMGLDGVVNKTGSDW